MIRNVGVFLTAALFGLLSLAGCGKGGLEPGMTGLTFQGTKPGAFGFLGQGYGAVAGSNAIEVRDRNGSQAGTLTLTTAKVVLKEIKFKRSGENVSDLKYQGPYIVDLLNGSVSPELPPVNLPAGGYERIELKLAKLEDGQVPAGDVMEKKSIYLEGTYTGNTAGGAVTDAPFVLSFELDEEFFLAGDRELVISATEPNPIIVAFRLSRWMLFSDLTVNDKDVDFSQVAVSGGKITLSDQSNGTDQKIWEVIRRAIKSSADFGKDADEDGVLESEEDDDEDTEDDLDA